VKCYHDALGDGLPFDSLWVRSLQALQSLAVTNNQPVPWPVSIDTHGYSNLVTAALLCHLQHKRISVINFKKLHHRMLKSRSLISFLVLLFFRNFWKSLSSGCIISRCSHFAHIEIHYNSLNVCCVRLVVKTFIFLGRMFQHSVAVAD